MMPDKGRYDDQGEVSTMPNIEHPEPGHYADSTGAWEDQMADDVHRWTERCIKAEEERDAARQQLRGAVDALAQVRAIVDDDWFSREARTGIEPRAEIRRVIDSAGGR